MKREKPSLLHSASFAQHAIIESTNGDTMDDKESLHPVHVTADEPSRVSPYELLIRQSKKLGYLATHTFDATKQFLKTDVSTIDPSTLLFGSKSNKDDAKNQKIQMIVKRSHEVLASAQTIMLPSNIFPDSILLDRSKLTITKRTFFWHTECITIRIEDILNVSSSLGPFFGSLNISSRVMNSTDHYEVTALLRRDAKYLKEIIQGYMIALHSKVNINHLTKNELITTLIDLGRDSKI